MLWKGTHTPKRREQEVLHEELADRELALRENNIGGIHEVEALKRFQEVRVDEFSRRSTRMIEDPDTINELTEKVQELPNEINCMSDSRDFKDAESVRSGQLSHIPSEPMLFPLPTCPGGLLSRARNSQPDIWNTPGHRENVASSPPYSSSLCSRIFHVWNDSTAERISTQTSTGTHRDKDTIPTLRFPRSSSAGNSFNPMEGRNFKNYGADQQRLQISELHFDKFPTPQTFSCWKIRLKTEVCICSNCPTEATLWIKEAEMVNPVADLKSSCSIQGTTPFPDYELLDAKIASALNTIFQSSYFKKKVSLEDKKLKKKTDSFEEDRSFI